MNEQTGLPMEYLGNYGTARGELDVFALINNPEANGVCRVAWSIADGGTSQP